MTSFRQGVDGYNGVVDTVLRQASPASNFGATQSLRVDAGTGVDSQALLRFSDLFGFGPGQIPLGATITSATLTLQVTNGSYNGGTVHRMLADWDDGATWNSMINGIQTDGTEAVATAESALGTVGIGSRDIDVGASLQAWASAGATSAEQNAANKGWLFDTASTDAWIFDSAEGAVTPLLTVEYTVEGPEQYGLAIEALDAVKPEGDAGPTLFTFTVTRGGGSADPASATWAVSGTGGLDAADFVGGELPAGTVDFLAGQVSKTLTLEVAGDTDVEADEPFTVTLSAPSANATLVTASAEGLVLDDDATPIVPTILTLGQGVDGYNGVVDTVLRQASPASNFGATQSLRVDAGTGVDSQALLRFSDLFGFGPGQIPLGATITSATLTLQVTNGSYNGGTVHRMLADWDDGATWNSMINGIQTDGTEAVATAESALGTVGIGSRDIDVGASLQAWASAGATSAEQNAANKGWLFDTASTDAWIFDSAEGAVTPLLTVEYTVEGPEQYGLAIEALDAVKPEGDAGPTLFTFTVTRGGGSADPASATWAVSGTGGLDAADFVGGELPAGTVDFLAGQVSKTLTLEVAGDTDVEADEPFTVTLSAPSANATLVTASAEGLVLDDDATPIVPTILTLGQGVDGYNGVVDTVLRQASPASNFGATQSLRVDAGTGVDSQALLRFSDLFGFGPGQIPLGATITSATLTLQVTNGSYNGGTVHRMLADWDDGATWNSMINGIQTDGTEAVATAESALGTVGIGSRDIDVGASLQAWASAGATSAEQNAANKGWLFDTASTDAWIFDSAEGAVTPLLTVEYTVEGPEQYGLAIEALDAVKPEGDAGPTLFTFTVTRGGGSADPASATWAVSGTGGLDAADFVGGELPAGTVDFLAGQVSKTLTLEVAGDTDVEADEPFTVTLSAPSANATLVTASAEGLVQTDDASPSPSLISVTYRQDANGYTGVLDTGIKETRPFDTFDTALALRVDAGSGQDTQALLGFADVFGPGPGQIPLGATITSATLTLQVTNGSFNGGTVHRMLADWEGDTNWYLMGNGVQTDGVEAVAAADFTMGTVSIGSRDIDVGASLQAWASAGPTSAEQNVANKGWLFKTPSTDAWDFESSQGTVKPLLSVSYIPDGALQMASIPTVNISLGTPSPQMEDVGATISFTLTLDQETIQDVTVFYSTVDGTAKAGSDYSEVTNQSVTFLSGETTKSIEVTLLDDDLVESPEAFTIQINSATDAQIGVASATGKIVDDDASFPAPPPFLASVVNIIDLTTANFRAVDEKGYGVGDPSGLAFLPGLQKLVIADSEHEEAPYYSDTNMFSIGLGGVVEGYNLTNFTDEPTGFGYSSGNGYLYIADDDEQEVFWVDPLNPSVAIGSFDTAQAGLTDTEDLKYDPATGHLFVLDGSIKKIVEFTLAGEFANSITLPSEILDAEAFAYDSVHDIFFVTSGRDSLIYSLDRSGNIVDTIDILNDIAFLNPISGQRPIIKGFELAPSSDPGDGDKLNLYAADYGVDQQNDGRLIEIDLGPDWFDWMVA